MRGIGAERKRSGWIETPKRLKEQNLVIQWL